jgi:hypothetical protein
MVAEAGFGVGVGLGVGVAMGVGVGVAPGGVGVGVGVGVGFVVWLFTLPHPFNVIIRHKLKMTDRKNRAYNFIILLCGEQSTGWSLIAEMSSSSPGVAQESCTNTDSLLNTQLWGSVLLKKYLSAVILHPERQSCM